MDSRTTMKLAVELASGFLIRMLVQIWEEECTLVRSELGCRPITNQVVEEVCKC